MATEYSGSGDPARSLPLLWRDQKRPTRGPRPGLSVDRVVAAAIELADTEGLEALSMRRWACSASGSLPGGSRSPAHPARRRQAGPPPALPKSS